MSIKHSTPWSWWSGAELHESTTSGTYVTNEFWLKYNNKNGCLGTTGRNGTRVLSQLRDGQCPNASPSYLLHDLAVTIVISAGLKKTITIGPAHHYRWRLWTSSDVLFCSSGVCLGKCAPLIIAIGFVIRFTGHACRTCIYHHLVSHSRLY
jgi:hypothetical protein